jgi:hypothetical protein
LDYKPRSRRVTVGAIPELGSRPAWSAAYPGDLS